MTPADAYQETTDRLITMLESGELPPWRKPWREVGDAFSPIRVNGEPYRGGNWWTLGMAAMYEGFTSPVWLTFKQARAIGAEFKAKTKGDPARKASGFALRPQQNHLEDPETGDVRSWTSFKAYRVFNLDQFDVPEMPEHLKPSDTEPVAEIERIEAAEKVLSDYLSREKIGFSHGGSRAYYAPQADRIQVPAFEHFRTAEEYYGTTFHEAAHSTGHSSRLDRGLDTELAPFGSADYSREELVAEMSAAFAAARLKLDCPPIENHAAYLRGWIKALKADSKAAIWAAGRAAKATDLIFGD